MFKLRYLNLMLLSATLVGCANIESSYQASQKDFQQYEAITQQYAVQEDWWRLYQDPQLNQLVDQALANNKNLAKAAISVNKALYAANLVGANLVPNFSAQTKSRAVKNIDTGGNSIIKHEGALNLSYTLDLWQRLADTASAAEWNYKASAQDLAATKLSLINAVVATYYQMAYLNDAIAATQESINYYNQINQIMQNRFRQGLADSASVAQTQQAVLNAQNSLINLQTQNKIAQQTLRNLLNLKPDESLTLKLPHILQVAGTKINLDVPISVIANRPDIKSAQYRLNAGFKDAKAMQKSWFPSITLGASLSSSGNKVDNALHTPFASGLVSINLPFLSWNTVKWNVKISEANYELAKVNFEQAITTALNEIDTQYFAYSQKQQNFANLQQAYKHSKTITQHYKNRYNAGVAQLREWLTAANTEKSTELAILNAKFQLIQQETAVYSAMAGVYTNK
ncbi:efflux transporter outer membrane subunit [[Haemophilus] felis]|nr:efflux transporter outer membrane subunit [[Haemophilus] felis]